MLRNYLKIAFRNFRKYKGFSFINILGLAVGMASCILILLWVQDELSFDRFHKNADDIFRIIHCKDNFQSRGAGSPAPLGPALEDEIPEVVNFARFVTLPKLVVNYERQSFYENKIVLADPAIFDMFTFPFVRGDAKTAFANPGDIVLTEASAYKYFGEEDPVGKILLLEGGDYQAKVSGVVKDIPYNSHIQFNFLLSFQIVYHGRMFGVRWGDFNFNTYVQLVPGTDHRHISEKATQVAIAHNCPQIKWDHRKFFLQPLADQHLDAGTQPAGVEITAPLGNKTEVYIFSIVAAFILALACINFMNLSTARSTNRIREIGMRKTIGANRSQLILQFFSESVLTAVFSILIGIVLVEIFLPAFNNFAGKNLSIDYFNAGAILAILGFTLVTGLFAGSYPALYLSSFHPVATLKGQKFLSLNLKKKNIDNSKSSNFRKTLVVLQFTLSIGLIIGTIVIYKQLELLRTKKLGFDKENILILPVREGFASEYESMKNRLLALPGVKSVSAKDWLQVRSQHNTSGYWWEGQSPSAEVKYISHIRVDYDYFKTMNLKLSEGRAFSKDFPTDANEAFIVNQEAVKAMGLTSPVGKQFSLYDNKGKIIGVMENAYFTSLHHKINPQVYHVLTDMNQARGYGGIFIKVAGEGLPQNISAIKSIWEEMNPISPFEYQFLDETIAAKYKAEKQASTIFRFFSSLAILISCLGLFGLASFTAEQRTKEIGIRKVLGASTFGIIQLMNIEFIKWILAAHFIAMPIAYYAMNIWLQNFAFRISMKWWHFVFAGILTLLVALITVSYQSIKAALSNPVDSLKYE